LAAKFGKFIQFGLFLLGELNDENLYDAAAQAVDFLTRHGKLSESLTPSWAKAFATVEFAARYGKPETPDGIQTNDPKIDWSAIANMIKELS
jgi:hypothetical protein